MSPSNTPAPSYRRSSWCPSPADDAAIATIADAMRRDYVGEAFPTRIGAIRYALRTVAATVEQTGHLPGFVVEITPPAPNASEDQDSWAA